MMKRTMLFILCSIFLGASYASAQTSNKTVTNADLQKFRQKRLQAEKELNENYRQLGFPSPEERAIQEEQDNLERSQLAERLRAERLEREQIQLEQEYQQSSNVYVVEQGANYGSGYNSYGSYPYYGYRNYNYRNRFHKNRYNVNPYRELYKYGRAGGFYVPQPYYPNNSIRNNRGGIKININNGGSRRPVRNRNPR